MSYEFKTKREPFARGFLNCDSESLIKKVASGLLLACQEANFTFDDNFLPNAHRGENAINYDYSMGINCWGKDYAQELCEKYPEDAEDIMRIYLLMKPHLIYSHADSHYTKQMKLATEAAHASGWYGHAVPALWDLCKYGTDHFRAKVALNRERNRAKDNDEFYDALDITLDAIDACGARCRYLAQQELLKTDDPEKIEKINNVIRTLTHAPKEPCRDFVEACIVYIMIFTMDGVDSPGHFDQYMYDFWKVTDPVERKKYLVYIWEFFHWTRTWNLCLSGSDENGNDLTNELTYEILDMIKTYKYETPNVTLRWHKNTPERLMKAAYEALASGTGLPGLYNDHAVIPALERLGIPKADAHTYVMNGCNQIDIPGKSHMGLEDGQINIGKAVEYTLHNGVSATSGRQVGPQTGDPRTFKDFDTFYAAFLKQMDHITVMCAEMSNMHQRFYSHTTATPIRSIFIEGCMEKGLDYKNRGPLYGNGQILAQGIADTADSLAAIKKYVYEEKRYSMDELIDALDKNFEGYDEMYHTLKNSELKFGNDIPFVDEIAGDFMNHYNSLLLTIETFRGGYFSGGCSPFQAAAEFGRAVAALPNGKKRREPLYADSIGATPGFDKNGPTALINSCLHFDHTLPGSGFILNVKFDKDVFVSSEGETTFLALWRSYFERGGQMMTATVVSPDELLDAQIHPENHRDLIVRVGGYSDRFVHIGKDLQENVIARTAHCKR
ncbi:MAG: hypothetical protein IJC98_04895 [Clostridia bacterium]|nr:hypothetical protein [Clostridia bacterium]